VFLRRIPVYQPDLSGHEKAYVTECLESGWISSKGTFVSRFEQAFAAYLKVPYGASVSNGTTALQTALGALGIGPGDEVIVPTFTYVASVNAITGSGATPVFVDCLSDTWQMDPSDVERKITSRTRAIMVVHLYGGACEMEPLMAVAARRHLFVVEDCAESFGTRYDGAYVGSFGDVATFSFYGNKTLTTGEGGMVVSRDPALHDRVVRYKSQGYNPLKEYWHESLGFNYRMTNICAAIGLAQLERVDAILEKKRRLAARYQAAFSGLPLQLQPEPARVFHTYWMISALCEDSTTLQGPRGALAAEGGETRPLFPPVHGMPMYVREGVHFPCAEALSCRGMNLPSWPGLGEDDVAFIAGIIRRFFSR
jgi:perosamine synthetase